MLERKGMEKEREKENEERRGGKKSRRKGREGGKTKLEIRVSKGQKGREEERGK